MNGESNSSVMTSSMPNMEISNELDKLCDRLGKFKTPATPSRLPKPEISPKPAHLMAQLAKHKVQSPSHSSSEKGTSQDKKTGSPSGTASMLKSTLKRMTKLTTSPPVGSSATIARSSSFKEPPAPGGISRTGSLKHQPQMTRSNSLRKVKTKDQMTNYPLSRSGSNSSNSGSGTLDRNFGVKRTPSMTTVRRFRDKDLNIKLSRGVQTQLTKDTVDEPEFADDGSIPTSLEFTVYLADLFGGNDNDQVETHVSEPTEPVDVRKNRQLTLDNMKLHRELEKLKQSANEHDLVKKELRKMREKFEEEQKARSRLEQMLEVQNKKVKQIVSSMDGVEREFEKRDANIFDLEGQLSIEKSKVDNLEGELNKASRIIESQKNELFAARKTQKTLVEQCEHVEGESRELQEFLQIEKMALTETLKDAENDIEALKKTVENKENQVKEAEERCGHLVRLGEQRHQELLTCQSQLKSFSEMAKSMLINQGTELYQFAHKLSTLVAKASEQEISTAVKDSELIKQEIEAVFKHLQSDNQNQADSPTDTLQTLSAAIEKRRRSESILAVKNTGNGAQAVLDNFDKLEQIIGELVNDKKMVNINDQNDQNQANLDSISSSANQESVDEMRAKFSKHLQIYKINQEQAESEIKRMDELYQELIENVLKTLDSVPESVGNQPELQRLKHQLENEASESLSSLVTSPTANSEVNGSGAHCNKNGQKVHLEPLNNSHDQENLSL